MIKFYRRFCWFLLHKAERKVRNEIADCEYQLERYQSMGRKWVKKYGPASSY